MLNINNVGPKITTRISSETAKIIFTLDKYLIPLLKPDQAENKNKTVTTAMMMT